MFQVCGPNRSIHWEMSETEEVRMLRVVRASLEGLNEMAKAIRKVIFAVVRSLTIFFQDLTVVKANNELLAGTNVIHAVTEHDRDQ
jgi:hypothetical protein